MEETLETDRGECAKCHQKFNSPVALYVINNKTYCKVCKDEVETQKGEEECLKRIESRKR